MGRLDNKVAVITGGNSGIGRATAELFCREGAKVIIAARREQENQAAVAGISAQGGEISAVVADVTQPRDCRRVIDEAIASYGRIDILVNNAGIADRHLPITRCTEDWFDQVVRTDLYSVYYMSKYALEHMSPAGKGSIVNISSIGAKGLAGISYSAAKAGVNAMTKNMAIEFGETDIRINAVAPGPTPTPLNRPEAVMTFDQEFAGMCAKHLDLQVPEAQVADQAEAILFFASDASRAVTGQILYVDHSTMLL